MVRHLRGALQRPAVLEIRGHARRPKRMVPDLRRDPGRPRAPLDHRIGAARMRVVDVGGEEFEG